MKIEPLAVGCLTLGLIAAAQAGSLTSTAQPLTAAEMDAVTAGALTYGPIAGAFSEAGASATGSFSQATTANRALTRVDDPDGLPAIANVYTTQTSGTAIAITSGQDASKSTAAAGALQQPAASVLGASINRTISGQHIQISVESSLYFGSFAYSALLGR